MDIATGYRVPSRHHDWGRMVANGLQKTGIYALLVILGLTFILPFFWMISTSLKLDPQVYVQPPSWWPHPFDFANYWRGLTYFPFGSYFLNTLLYCVGSAVGCVASGIVVAYGFSRLEWKGRDTIFWIVLATLMLPFSVQIIPLYLIFRDLGWLNTYLPLIVPYFFGDAYSIFFLRQFFRTVPRDLSDAAKIDGANEVNIMVRIVLPLVKPAIAVVGLFQFMNAWNDYLGPLIYINKTSQYPLALGLQEMQQAFTEGVTVKQAWPELMAVSAVIMMPVVVLYFFVQRVFVRGITFSGLRG